MHQKCERENFPSSCQEDEGDVGQGGQGGQGRIITINAQCPMPNAQKNSN
jgi:hypothetical protein